MIGAMVQETRAIRGLPFCDDVEMQVYVVAWGRVLEEVPTENLDSAFSDAVKTVNPEHNVTPGHVLEAYKSVERLRLLAELDARLSKRSGRKGHE